jgi:hypothetical protein
VARGRGDRVSVGRTVMVVRSTQPVALYGADKSLGVDPWG